MFALVMLIFPRRPVRQPVARVGLPQALLVCFGLVLAFCSGPSGAQAPAPPVPLASSAAAKPAAAARPIFVLNSLDATVSVVDPLKYTELRRIPVGKEPHHLYLTPDEKSLLVANAASDSLTFIDPVTAQVQRTVTGISDPYQLRFSPDMKWFVTLANRLNHVDIYRWQPESAAEPLKLVKRIATGKTPSHQWIDSKSSVVYATMQDSDELVAVDLATQSIRWRVPTGKMPADVYLTADDRFVLSASPATALSRSTTSPPARPGWSSASKPGRARTPSAPRATSATCSSATGWPTPSA